MKFAWIAAFVGAATAIEPVSDEYMDYAMLALAFGEDIPADFTIPAAGDFAMGDFVEEEPVSIGLWGETEVAAGIVVGIAEEGSFDNLIRCVDAAEHEWHLIIDGINKVLGGWVKKPIGIAELIEAWDNFPNVIHECRLIRNEIDMAETWITNLVSHQNLKRYISIQISKHPIQVKQSMTIVNNDMAAGDYFAAGVELGKLLVILTTN